MLTNRERWKNQRHGTSSMFFLISTQKTWLRPNKMVDLEVACMIFLLKDLVRCFCREWRGETYQTTKNLARVGSWFDVFYHLRRFESNKKTNNTSVMGCALKVVWSVEAVDYWKHGCAIWYHPKLTEEPRPLEKYVSQIMNYFKKPPPIVASNLALGL